MRNIVFTVLYVALTSLFLGTAPAWSQQVISPEKRALILEIRQISTQHDQTVGSDAKPLNVGKSFMMTADREVGLAGDQKAEFKKLLNEAGRRIDRQIDELSADRAVRSSVLDEAYLNVYDRHFNETELVELVRFYRTPTGKKSLNMMAAVTSEVTETFTKALNSKLQVLINAVLRDEWTNLNLKIEEIKKQAQ